jgi:hypothetical protein
MPFAAAFIDLGQLPLASLIWIGRITGAGVVSLPPQRQNLARSSDGRSGNPRSKG